ncbi:hypothetical protein D5S17_32430 [Pseudonocardiaceae bacterium YIM PH 21723]|nr:hypothetical protein D5S17_32430 [Pseudonocardiaceae bacterium YIM PH 21723]
MLVVWAVSPLFAALCLSTVFRRPAHITALCGLAIAVALALAVPGFDTPPTKLGTALGVSGILVLSVVAVMVPGLYLNEVLKARRVHERLTQWVRELDMPAAHKRALVVTGLAPALESMTGYGVSLLVTVPVMLALTERERALRGSMLTMAIMPWGTLGLATVIAAQQTGNSPSTVGLSTLLYSGWVFPLFGVLASRSWAGLALGGLLSGFLVLFNWLGVVEPAGVLAGLLVTAIGMLVLGRPHRMPIGAWGPYGLLLAVILLLRLLPTHSVAVSAGSMHWYPLSSAGVPLLITALLVTRGAVSGGQVSAALARVRKPLTAVTAFALMSQLMVASGMITAIGGVLAGLSPVGVALVAPALALMSGFLTGSTVGGNALLMDLQLAVGRELGHPLVFTGLQNAGAGHSALASLPMIVLICAIAGEKDESKLIRFGLLVLGVLYLVFAGVTVVSVV